MYSFMDIIDGIKYTVYFFGSFSGHFHPYTPIHPLAFDDVYLSIKKYDRAVYYQGWYSDTKEGPRLDRFLKYRLIGRSFKTKMVKVDLPGVYYFRLKKVGDEWIAKEAIAPETVLKQKHYLRYVVNNDGELDSAYHIYATLMYRYIYTYNEKGALINVDNIAYEIPSEIPDI